MRYLLALCIACSILVSCKGISQDPQVNEFDPGDPWNSIGSVAQADDHFVSDCMEKAGIDVEFNSHTGTSFLSVHDTADAERAIELIEADAKLHGYRYSN